MFTAAAQRDRHLLVYNQWPSSSSPSPKSHLPSLSTTSSLSSTFSDVSLGSLPSAHSPDYSSSLQQSSKTSAFFASPFCTRPPSPSMIPPSPPRSVSMNNSNPSSVNATPSRSLTTDFFATQSDSHSSIAIPTSMPPPSRLFPSRYTSIARPPSPPSPTLAFTMLDDSDPSRSLPESADASRTSTSTGCRVPALVLHAPPANAKAQSVSSLAARDADHPTPRPTSYVPTALPVPPVTIADMWSEGEHNGEPTEGMVISSSSTMHGHLSSSAPSPSQFISPLRAASEKEVNVRLVRTLGHGAFSSVWLADDLSATPLTLASKRSIRELRKASISRNSSTTTPSRKGTNDAPLSRASSIRDVVMPCTTSPMEAEFHDRYTDHSTTTSSVPDAMSCSPPAAISRAGSVKSTVSRSGSLKSMNSLKRRLRNVTEGGTKLVAVKMTSRDGGFGHGPEAIREREKTKAGFIREVEVLRHISHPNITSLLASLTTATHHILVLPYLPGGDLLSLVNNDIAWSKLGEDVLKRMWCELCKAVSWMHSVGIVHRDIKLENILLTTSMFSELEKDSPRPTLSQLPPAPLPIIKLTDFGLARFIDVPASPSPVHSAFSEPGEHSDPFGSRPSSFDSHSYNNNNLSKLQRRPATKRTRTLLSTRCGSEAYAAPELVMGGAGGIYDARETDAWACGVVLYALIGRKLPFGEGVGAIGGARIGGEPGRVGAYTSGKSERRAWLMKIARGEWVWPMHEVKEGAAADKGYSGDEGNVLVGPQLVESAGARRIVEKLLIRDPGRRAVVSELWDDEWMCGSGVYPTFGGPDAVELQASLNCSNQQHSEADPSEHIYSMDHGRYLQPYQYAHHHQDDGSDGDEMFEIEGEDVTIEDDDDGDYFDEEDEEGWLVDEEGIHSIARQEVV